MKNVFKIIIAQLILSILLVGCHRRLGDVKDARLTKNDVIAHIGAVTIALVSQRDHKVLPYCTGVWVDERTILTAQHCVQSAANHSFGIEDAIAVGSKIQFINQNEAPDELFAIPKTIHLGTVSKEDKLHDLAVIKVDGESGSEYATLGLSSPGIGERLHIIGHVRGLYWTYMEGIASAYRKRMPENGPGPFLQVSAPIFFGNSGGGVFNAEGKLVGIASFIHKAPNTAFFIHLDSIKNILK